MGWMDKYMPLGKFNQLLTGCGYEPVTLDNGYLVFSTVRRIYETDFSDKTVVLNGKTYSCAGSTSAFPEFARRAWMYFVVPDEAVEGMQISDLCAAYTLKDHRPDAEALLSELTYIRNTEEGAVERSDFAARESYRIFKMANAGTLIIGALYVSTVFVCMALAILAVKTLSALESERRRFAILYRLGADERMQKSVLLRQTGAFFLMPFAFPLLMTIPIGVIFGKVYEIWNLTGLGPRQAMETALIIALVIAGTYALHFVITYRIACSHVLCCGDERQDNFS